MVSKHSVAKSFKKLHLTGRAVHTLQGIIIIDKLSRMKWLDS